MLQFETNNPHNLQGHINKLNTILNKIHIININNMFTKKHYLNESNYDNVFELVKVKSKVTFHSL